jgi:hypothetical protein
MSKPENKTPAGAAPTKTEGKPQSGGQPHGHGQTGGGGKGGNVVSLPGMCMAEGCKHKSEKANFCMEHFDWFKEGLITKEGRRPSDFDKKHWDYTRRKNKKVA